MDALSAGEVLTGDEPPIEGAAGKDESAKKGSQVSLTIQTMCVTNSVMIQSMAALLAPFVDSLDKVIHAVADSNVDPMTGMPCYCGKPGHVRQYRCHDCTQFPASCKECYLHWHKFNPLHRPLVFNGDFFNCVQQADIEQVLYLGHNANPCPKLRTEANCPKCCSGRPCGQTTHHKPTRMTVADHNGTHVIDVMFCVCEGPPDRVKQLLDARLFPATYSTPQTALSFRLLEQFCTLNHTAQTTTYHYEECLRRFSDPDFPDCVPVSSEVLSRSSSDCSIFRMYMRH